jgi:hypothetical protein
MPSSTQPRTARPAHRLDRRVVLKASAALAAMSLLGGRAPRAAAGPGLTGTIAGEWREAEASLDVDLATSEQSVDGQEPRARRRRFKTDFTFYAVAPHWAGEAEPGATVEVSLSADGDTWTEPVAVRQADAENGRPERDGRRFGQLVATEGASFVAYQAFDAAGEPTTLPDLAFAYIDATPGPTLAEAQQPALDPAFAPPPIVSRQAWGANEALRYNAQGEIWPVAYAPVEHLVIHHTDTANFQDPLVAIRSVYYYHTVVRGWGDIGYNYLVDFLGNVYEGRVGGEGAVAGHAAGYNERTAGIGTIGRFDFEAATPEAQTALVWITAWAGRNLNPLGAKPFGEIASLPTICAHRDVNPTACPGDALYGGLAALRDYVDAVLAGGASPEPPPPAFVPGDTVVAVVADAPVQATPEAGAPVVARLPLGEPLTIADGPATVAGEAWYAVRGATAAGWTPASGLAPNPNGPVVSSDPAVGGGEVAAEPAPVAFQAPPDGPFAPGEVVRVVDGALNLHSGPGLSTPVVAVLPDATLLTVAGGPAPADGYDWYQVDGGAAGFGWCAGAFLRRA